ncbi:MAG: UDP-2,4-diacetamido-2,4,6-trideoxy-beta-L-altropyranose hydrolase [Lachnospiraceae bacterium]|nr:UDP-2,4-diacetamido-2,4,6-trideoxy-beta-L-altropyranose hydrolase [Lachnospiraceae bacterium]
MKVIFRADANANIGQGHVMRCLSIADSFKEAGHICVFVCADKIACSMASDRGYDSICLESDYSDTLSELTKLDDIIQKEKADILVMDGYFFSNDYFKAVKHPGNSLKTVYIDDLYSFAYDVDCVINYNVYASGEKYEALYDSAGVNEKPCFILGSEYAPLRSEFADTVQKQIPEKAKDVMISVGGADPLHLAKDFVDHIVNDKELKDINFNFVLGKMEKDIDEIKRIAASTDNIIVNVNVPNMKEMIENADIAVSAAGSTQYEICACKTPCICFSMADNQLEGAKEFDRLGAFIYAGDARENRSFTAGLFKKVKELASDSQMRALMSEISGRLVDGLGAKRIVKETEELFGRE